MWIDFTLRDGRKTSVLRGAIVQVTEYPCEGKNLAEIEIAGRTWRIVTAEEYEEVLKRLAGLGEMKDGLYFSPINA